MIFFLFIFFKPRPPLQSRLLTLPPGAALGTRGFIRAETPKHSHGKVHCPINVHLLARIWWERLGETLSWCKSGWACACWAGESQVSTRERLPVGLKYNSESGNGVRGLGCCSVTLGEIQRNFFFFPKPTSGDIFCLLRVFSRALCVYSNIVSYLSFLCSSDEGIWQRVHLDHLILYLVPLQSLADTGMLFCTPCRQCVATECRMIVVVLLKTTCSFAETSSQKC